MSLTAGTRLGAYEVLGLIGIGGMGEVYRARDTRLGRDVAIKVLPAAFSADRARLHRFEQEARAAAAVNHPNIVTIHSVEQVEGVHFLTMELVEGKTLVKPDTTGGSETASIVPGLYRSVKEATMKYSVALVVQALHRTLFMTCAVLCLVLLVLFFASFGWAQNAQPVQSAIPGVIAPGARVELVRGGFKGLEGPVATPDGGLYFSDIPASRIYKLDKNGDISVWRENTKGTNGLFLLKDGRLLGAESGGPRIVAVMPDGRVTPLAAESGGKALRSPNDLIADSKGGIYFTDPVPRPAPNVAPKEPGNVHYIRPNGAVLLLDDQIPRPNGITLSLDEKTLYVDNTEGEYVYAFDVQPDGRATNKREFVKLREPEQGSLGLRSRADGMALDSNGRLYVATAAGIQVIDSRGQYLGTIRLPSVARNVAFAGPRRQTLYLTALESLYRVQMRSEGPRGRAK